MDDRKHQVVKDLITEANKALEAHEFFKADLFCDEALRLNEENFLPYLIKVLAQNKVTEIEDLKNCDFDFNSDSFIKFRFYANKQLNEELDSHLWKLKGFVNYRYHKNGGEQLGNVVDDSSNEKVSNESYSGYDESGNVEAEDYSQENKIRELKKIEFDGAISRIEENDNKETKGITEVVSNTGESFNKIDEGFSNSLTVLDKKDKSSIEINTEQEQEEEKNDEEYSTTVESNESEGNFETSVLYPDEIVNEKLSKNEAKYPVEKAKGKANKYNKL